MLDDRTALTGDMVYDLNTVGCFTEDPRFPVGSYSLNWICSDGEVLKNSVRKVLAEADVFYGGHGTPMGREIVETLV